MKVPMLDLKLQYQQLKHEIEPAMAALCESQIFILGEKVEAFEKSAAEYCHSNFACAVSSGSDALLMALMAENIGPGDEVITTPYTFFATAGAVARVGATPVFVDIKPDTFTIDPAQIPAKITEKTKVIIPVHLYGQAADMDPIMEIAAKNNLVVIEDAAQAIGTQYKGKTVGTIGDYGCLSFFPSKNLGGFGDGGMVLTQKQEKAEKISKMRNHGMAPRYCHHFVGGNFRMDAIQALVLGIKIKYLDSWTEGRQNNAKLYNTIFSGAKGLITPVEAAYSTRHVRNQYVLRILNGKRNQLWDALKAANIGCDVYYPIPLHLQECFKNLGYAEGDFPESEKAAKETLAIPVYPELTEEQIRFVASTITGITE